MVLDWFFEKLVATALDQSLSSPVQSISKKRQKKTGLDWTLKLYLGVINQRWFESSWIEQRIRQQWVKSYSATKKHKGIYASELHTDHVK